MNSFAAQCFRRATKTLGGLEERCGQRAVATTAATAAAPTAVPTAAPATAPTAAATVRPLLSAQRCHRHRLVWSERHPTERLARPRESERTQHSDALRGVRRAGRLRRRLDVFVLQLVGHQRREDAAQERRHNGERQRQDHHVQAGIVERETTARPHSTIAYIIQLKFEIKPSADYKLMRCKE